MLRFLFVIYVDTAVFIKALISYKIYLQSNGISAACMNKFFLDLKKLIFHPVLFAEVISSNNISFYGAYRGQIPLGGNLLFQFVFCLIYALLSSLTLYFTPSNFLAGSFGINFSVQSPFCLIFFIAFFSSVLTNASIASLSCAYMSFLSKGRLSIRLPLLLVLLPAFFCALLFLSHSLALRVMIIFTALILAFIPAVKNYQQFVGLLYCFFSSMLLWAAFQILLLISIALNLGAFYSAIQFTEAIAMIFYFVCFGKAFYKLSSAKTASAFFSVIIAEGLLFWAISYTGILPHNINNLLMLL